MLSRTHAYFRGTDVEPTECNRVDPGSMYDEGECNTNLCVRWSQWRSTGCSVTCNRGEDEPPGVVLTRRVCLEPEEKRGMLYMLRVNLLELVGKNMLYNITK